MGVSRPTPRGEVEGSSWEEGSPDPHPGEVEESGLGGLQAYTEGVSRPRRRGVYRPTPYGGVQTPPPSRQLLLWVVSILLECILVCDRFKPIE